MTINKQKNENGLFISLEGRLDTTTSPALEQELKESLEGVELLTLDFEKLDYISSAGLRVLLSAQKTMNKQGEMKIKNVNETILEIFEVTGFNDILTIE
ncbi:MAG: STAS domain-containing protein [Clostridia bacterium]|nr:STAS domain-containing protein [Clostridia bacterium]MBP5656955.1 STAS domain-containing protein [Clostridia bacterium]